MAITSNIRYVAASGDTTGVTDSAAIAAAFAVADTVVLASDADYRISEPITMTHHKSLFGVGVHTIVKPRLHADPFDEPMIALNGDSDPDISGSWATIGDMVIEGGQYGILMTRGGHTNLRNLGIGYATSHGIMMTGGTWCVEMVQCQIGSCTGDGINAISLDTGNNSNGNQLSITGCRFMTQTGAAIRWSANGLNVTGNLFENNAGGGIVLNAEYVSCRGANICGNYFESNSPAIHLDGPDEALFAILGVHIAGNYFTQETGAKILIEGRNNCVRGVVIDYSNEFAGAATDITAGNAAHYCRVDTTHETWGTLSHDENVRNDWTGSRIMPAAAYYYFGKVDSNGSWRIGRSGDDLVIERRESGSWVTKSTIAAA